jgi:hypothetical protein
VVSFMLQPLYPQGKSPWYPLYSRFKNVLANYTEFLSMLGWGDVSDVTYFLLFLYAILLVRLLKMIITYEMVGTQSPTQKLHVCLHTLNTVMIYNAFLSS